jgi:hypothetical protein
LGSQALACFKPLILFDKKGLSTPKADLYYHYEFEIKVYKRIAITTLVGPQPGDNPPSACSRVLGW